MKRSWNRRAVLKQLAATSVSRFCHALTLFRSHGRPWKLRALGLQPGAILTRLKIRNYDGASVPDAGQLHNPQVEPICRTALSYGLANTGFAATNHFSEAFALRDDHRVRRQAGTNPAQVSSY